MIDHIVVYDIFVGAYLLGLAKVYVYRDLQDKFSSSYRYLLTVFVPYLALVGLASASFTLGIDSTRMLVLTVVSLTSLYIVLDRTSVRNALSSGFLLGTGLLLVAFFISGFSFEFFTGLEILLMATLFTVPVIFALYVLGKPFLLSSLVFTQFLDASSTVIAIRRGLEESRILANVFIKAFGPYGIFLMKFLVFLPVTYYLGKRTMEGEDEKDIYSLLFWSITAYAFVLAVRNYFLISAT